MLCGTTDRLRVTRLRVVCIVVFMYTYVVRQKGIRQISPHIMQVARTCAPRVRKKKEHGQQAHKIPHFMVSWEKNRLWRRERIGFYVSEPMVIASRPTPPQLLCFHLHSSGREIMLSAKTIFFFLSHRHRALYANNNFIKIARDKFSMLK